MSQRKPLIAGNWKMNKTISEAVAFVQELNQSLTSQVENAQDVDVVVAPTSPALYSVAQALKDSQIQVSAQNVHPKASGAFTGEQSVGMLKDAGCTFCIIGHSERRQIFGEQDAFIREKLDTLLAEGVNPIFCIGESLEEREAGKTFERVSTQLTAAFDGLSTEQALKVVVAYEPIWAIGTGKTATPEQAQEVHAYLRGQLAERYDTETAAQIRILYGGSVKPANVKALMSESDIDGALVGGASLKVDSFTDLVNFRAL